MLRRRLVRLREGGGKEGRESVSEGREGLYGKKAIGTASCGIGAVSEMREGREGRREGGKEGRREERREGSSSRCFT